MYAAARLGRMPSTCSNSKEQPNVLASLAFLSDYDYDYALINNNIDSICHFYYTSKALGSSVAFRLSDRSKI